MLPAREGRTYGTILVDLAQGCPIDLLPDRSAETLAHWLKEHPGVELISRDRTGAYAEGAAQGAPDAVQVADRWHILKNLGDALSRVFADVPQARDALKAIAEPPMQSLEPGNPAPGRTDPLSPRMSVEDAPPAAQTRREQERQQRRERREARYEEVQALLEDGVSLRTIAQQLHLSRETVRKYARASTAPLPQPRANRASLLDPYKPYLVERWNAGCHIGAELLREIEAQGYQGGRSITLDFVAALRKQQGIAPMKRAGLPPQNASDPTRKPPTPRELAWLVLQRPDRLDATEQTCLMQFRQAAREVETAVTLAQEFASMVRERRAEMLDDWLERSEGSGLSALPSFANGIRRDHAAVKAALSLPYSNGVTEGNVNRLKYLKRQMYGRAKFDLLRKRVLYAA